MGVVVTFQNMSCEHLSTFLFILKKVLFNCDEKTLMPMKLFARFLFMTLINNK